MERTSPLPLSDETAAVSTLQVSSHLFPIVRTIRQTNKVQRIAEEIVTEPSRHHNRPVTTALLDCAYHITHAFAPSDRHALEALRHRVPLDVTRPTCPRRFVTEKQDTKDCTRNGATDDNNQQYDNKQHREDGWVGALLDRTVASWNLPHTFVSLPWYRFLEYTVALEDELEDAPDDGVVTHQMAKHTDGSNVHPVTGQRSVATMLIYLSSCPTGGATTLYHLPTPKQLQSKGQRRRQRLNCPPTDEHSDEDPNKNKQNHCEKARECCVLEHIKPVYNTAVIFPHAWPHAGQAVDPVHPKIALRVDLALARQTS